MTIEEAFEEASAALNAHTEHARAAGLDLLLKQGATVEELESFLQWFEVDHAEWKAKALISIRGWLEREGKKLH